MERNEAHPFPDAAEDALDRSVTHFAMGGVAPPKQDVGLIEPALRQAVLVILQRRGLDFKSRVLPQTFRNAVVHPVGINPGDDGVLALVHIFAPDEDADLLGQV